MANGTPILENATITEVAGIVRITKNQDGSLLEVRGASGGSNANTLYTKTDVDNAIAAALLAALATYPTVLTTVVADCSNTDTETAVITVTVPAATWADGKGIGINGYFETKQNSGGAKNLTLKAKVNSGSVTLASAVSVSDNATTGKSFRGITLVRVGADVVMVPGSSTGGDFMPNTTVLTAAAGFATNNFSANIFTSVDFTAAITITLTATWATADATAFFNCKYATAYRY